MKNKYVKIRFNSHILSLGKYLNIYNWCKNWTYCYSNNQINVNFLHLKNDKLHEKLFEGISIYCTGFEVSYKVKPSYFIFHKINAFIEDHDGIKYQKIFPTDEKNKDLMKNVKMCGINLKILWS